MTEMCFGGDLGVKLNLKPVGSLRTDVKLFSESNGRWLVEVRKKDSKKFEKMVDAVKLGSVTKAKRIVLVDGKVKVKLDLEKARDRWNSAVAREVPK
jgi:phosphoribosylformylglycinamidine (FGAM) synthase-like enzyme